MVYSRLLYFYSYIMCEICSTLFLSQHKSLKSLKRAQVLYLATLFDKGEGAEFPCRHIRGRRLLRRRLHYWKHIRRRFTILWWP